MKQYPSTQKMGEMRVHAAIYIRVSTGAQAHDGHSLDIQHEGCMVRAVDLGFSSEDVLVFREAGASGEDMDRPELQRLLDMAQNGRLTHVIVKHPDRLSRNMADKAIIVRELQRHGVELVFIDVPDWDKSDEATLLFNIIGSIAEYELRQIRRRTLSGKLRAVREGQVMPSGIDPYGYRYQEGQLVVVKEEAVFVRLMYQWYAMERMSFRDIAKRLDDLGVPTKTRGSRHWSHATVSHILANELYRGHYFFNRRVTVKARGRRTSTPRRHRRVERWRVKRDWIEVTVPQIVDEGIFELVQFQRSQKQRASGRRHEHLLHGKLMCSLCRRRWHAAVDHGRGKTAARRYYRRPPERSASERECANRCLPVDAFDVEHAVWEMVVKAILQCEFWSGHWRDRENQVLLEQAGDLKQVEWHAGQLLRAQERLVNLYLHGDIDRAEFERRTSELESQSKAIDMQKRWVGGALERSRQRGHQTMERVAAILNDSTETSPISFALKKFTVELLVEEVLIDASHRDVFLSVSGPITYLSAEK